MTTSSPASNPDAEVRLVFLAGYPRSGTTWFSNLINASPEVVYRHEFLGRLWRRLPGETFQKLKKAHGLDAGERNQVLATVLEAHPAADRPPFFNKAHLAISHPGVHQFCWLIASRLPALLSGPYRALFTPKPDGQTTLLIKETRSAVDLDSILAGLAPDHLVILFRHPCGALASQLRGIAEGLMPPPDEEALRRFLRQNSEQVATLDLDTDAQAFLALPIEAQLAAMWCAQNLRYLELSDHFGGLVVDYDDFYLQQNQLTPGLASALGLSDETAMLDFLDPSGSRGHGGVLSDSSSSFYSVYRDSGFRTDRWRDELRADQIDTIESVAGQVYDTLCRRTTKLDEALPLTRRPPA